MTQNNPMNHCLVSIVGLTASGKSAIGIKLAQLFNGEIISADSRQVYRGLDIGSAKVTPTERKLVRHHLLDIVQPMQPFDVFSFQQLANQAIIDICARGKLPIIVGGTGLYSRAVVEGYSFDNRQTNTAHTVRPCLQIALLPPKDWLRPRIEQRNKQRLADGNLDETKNLLASGVTQQWLQTLGLDYYWNVELVLGRITQEEYLYWLTTKTMQYAKRQRTWFKREKNTIFLENPDTFETDCIALVQDFLLNNKVN